MGNLVFDVLSLILIRLTSKHDRFVANRNLYKPLFHTSKNETSRTRQQKKNAEPWTSWTALFQHCSSTVPALFQHCSSNVSAMFLFHAKWKISPINTNLHIYSRNRINLYISFQLKTITWKKRDITRSSWSENTHQESRFRPNTGNSDERGGERRWEAMRGSETRWDSMRLDETRWDSMRLDETRWDSMRLDETRWDSMRLVLARSGSLSSFCSAVPARCPPLPPICLPFASHLPVTARHKPTQTDTNRHKPTQTDTDRIDPKIRQIFIKSRSLQKVCWQLSLKVTTKHRGCYWSFVAVYI